VTLKVEAVLPYFHEPSLLIGPQGHSRRPRTLCWLQLLRLPWMGFEPEDLVEPS
jgi:hypothetical protein